MMRALVSSVAIAVLAAIGGRAGALEPERPGQESFLQRAAFADGRLWTLSDAGELSSIGVRKDARLVERLSEPALDLCVSDGHPLVVTGKPEISPAWTLWRRVAGQWTSEATVKTEGDDLVALDCGPGRVTLVTSGRLIDLAEGKQSVTALSERLRSGLVTSTLVTDTHVFVGIDKGEFGGGLRRVDRKTGEVKAVASVESAPVNGIAPAPGRPGCVVAAVGLVHRMSYGRLVEICGDAVRTIFSKRRGGETVAFFGVAATGDGLWAAGIDGLYHLGVGAAVRATPLPSFTNVRGIRVAFMSRLALVLTSINQRRSLSGDVPMVVAR
jgi:hypothetical protein